MVSVQDVLLTDSVNGARAVQALRVAKGLILLLLGVPLSILTVLGSFSRYLADDYCTHGTLVERGLFGSQAYWYLNWSGRYAFTLMVNLTQLLGPSMTPVLIPVAIPLWLAALAVSLRIVLRGIQGSTHWFLPLLLGSLILVATVNGTPDLYQSTLWHTGVVTYLVPLILGTAYVGWISSHLQREPAERSAGGWRPAASLACAFVAGGFSETYVSVQIAGLLALSLATFIARWRRKLLPIRGVAIAGLIGSVLAALVIVGAPGNEIRRSVMPDPVSLLSVFGWSVRHTFAFIAKSVIQAPATNLLSVVLPIFAAVFLRSATDGSLSKSRTEGRSDLLIAIPILTFLLILASILPSVYATSAYPAERALITAQYLLIASTVLWSLILGGSIQPTAQGWFEPHQKRRAWVTGAILALTLVGSLATTQRILSWLPDSREFAQSWDRRDAAIREAVGRGVLEQEIASLSHMAGLAEVGYDPSEWINICVADSYGLVSVIAK